ncbi:hypothetical protein H5410_027546 [Solanum commersonii]|uniref:Uncharacterized protein n=1 Tax=Solanum commersonii TaxID=4109 RepID=A0A9J5Z4S2_SOLCO|nr:hypothetical protein H5410_027546 [Solanum commersonii]
MDKWIKRGHNCSNFFQEKDKVKEGSRKVHTSHKVGLKRGILSNYFTLQTSCLRVLASRSQLDQ